MKGESGASIVSALLLISLGLPLYANLIAIYIFALFALYSMFQSKQFRFKSVFVLLSAAFFSVHLFHYFDAEDAANFWFEVERKVSFAILPLMWLNLPITDYRRYFIKVSSWFSYGMSILGIVFLVYAFIRYLSVSNVDVFYYHSFVEVFEGSAIYYSLLYIISLIFLFENNKSASSFLGYVLIVWNTLLLILLSSKMFVLIAVCLHVYYFFSLKFKRTKYILLLVGFAFIGFQFLNQGENIFKRYADIDFHSVFQEKEREITPATTFDGLSLRMELLKIGRELSTENLSVLLFGNGPGDTQAKLNAKIKERNMYTGEPGQVNTGFLGYNFHNQYMQTFSEVGLTGLFALVVMLGYLLFIGIKRNNKYLLFVNLTLLLAFMSESFLSRQTGIVTFVSMNSFLILVERKAAKKNIIFSLKRVSDIVFSLMVLVFLLSWLLPILFLFIYLETGSSPIFRQERVGLNNKTFDCFKLRTMFVNNQAHSLAAQQQDHRVTVLGKYLRKYGIDELPQFFNVLRNEMSIVGPRPLMLKEEQQFNELIHGFSSRLSIKPGITGLAQAHGYKGFVEGNFDIRIRYRLDLLYAKEQSLLLDFKIIARTFLYLLKQ